MELNKIIQNDQHFMIDNKILDFIASYCNFEEITEIGPGNGYLTKKLLERSKVEAIEIDKNLFEEIQKYFPEDIKKGNLAIKNENALDKDVKFKPYLFSNLPYSISEPLLYKLIRQEVKEAYLVTGKDFYYKISTEGKLSQITKEIFKIKKLKEIPKESFEPKPRTESVFFSLKLKPLSPLAQIYKQYDKKLKNALLDYLTSKQNITKNHAKIKIEEATNDKLKKILSTKIRQIKHQDFHNIKDILTKCIQK